MAADKKAFRLRNGRIPRLISRGIDSSNVSGLFARLIFLEFRQTNGFFSLEGNVTPFNRSFQFRNVILS